MGREGAGERRWFCVSSLAASQGILHPTLASGASEVLSKGCWQENVIYLLKNVLLFTSEVYIYLLTSPNVSLSENYVEVCFSFIF